MAETADTTADWARCFLCQRSLYGCFGGCFSSDVNAALEGRIAWTETRQICWACLYTGKHIPAWRRWFWRHFEAYPFWRIIKDRSREHG